MLIMKFGGTSVGSAKNIAAVCRIVKKHVRQGPVVVVSAVTKMTDALIELALNLIAPHPRPLPPRTRTSSVQGRQGERESVRLFQKIKRMHQAIVDELQLPQDLLREEFEELENLMIKAKRIKDKSVKTLDHVQSFGERMSAKIVAAQLGKIGMAAHAIPAWEIGMITDDRFGNAEPLSGVAMVIRRKLHDLLRDFPSPPPFPAPSMPPLRFGSVAPASRWAGPPSPTEGRGRRTVVPVITGYIGKTRKGEITTLWRGGSDYSAAIIGAAIGAKSIQIWTDVDGVMTADPRIVRDARIVPELAFEEACELAYFGAKVLYPKTLLPAMEKNIPVQVLNTFNPGGKGTTIVRTFAERRLRSRTVEAFACKKGVGIVHVRSLGFYDGNALMARIFDLLKVHRVVIDLVAISVAGVAFAIDTKNNFDIIIHALKRIGKVTAVRGKAIICAVGGSINAAGVSGKMFATLGRSRIPVEMISQAAGGVSMTFVVDEADAEKAMRVLHGEHIGH